MAPRARKASAPPIDPEVEAAKQCVLDRFGLKIGQTVKVDGEGHAKFKIRGVGVDGSLTCVSDDGRIRSFMADWCYPPTRVNSRGREVEASTPTDVKGRRAAWISDRGLPSGGCSSGCSHAAEDS